MNKILITGADSFVGKNILRYSKYKAIDEISLFNKKPNEIRFDLYDCIIHLVAIVHQTITIPEAEYYKINCDLTLDVAREAKKAGVKQFIFMSTVKVYGEYNNLSGVWNEESECKPEDAYGKSKYAAEIALKQLIDENFTVSIIRTPLVYGEGVKANMRGLVKLVRRSWILPLKSINNRRNFTSVANLVAFIDRIIEKRASGVFIAMDKEAISTTELVQMLADAMGKKLLLFKIPDFLIEAGMKIIPGLFDRLYGSYEMDNKITLKVLDFEAPFTTREGIRLMIESFHTRSINRKI